VVPELEVGLAEVELGDQLDGEPRKNGGQKEVTRGGPLDLPENYPYLRCFVVNLLQAGTRLLLSNPGLKSSMPARFEGRSFTKILKTSGG
jgi:hypothetical protein